MELKLLQITDKKINQFHKAGIFTVEDLLSMGPKRYIDARKPRLIDNVGEGAICRVDGRIKYINSTPRGIFLTITDGVSSKWLKVAFFSSSYLLNELYEGAHVTVVGKFKYDTYNGKTNLSIANPKRFSIDSDKLNRIIPVYKKIQGMSEDYYESCVAKALEEIKFDDYLSGDILIEQDLCPLQSAYQMLHMPTCRDDIVRARKRLTFDKLFLFNLMLEEKKLNSNNESPYRFKGCELMKQYFASMPFDLTQGQKDVVKNLYATGKSGKKINTLLQADVGYGKTECAKMLALFGVEAGCQVALIAPTTVLAHQHFEDFSRSFQGLPLEIGYLTSELTSRERKKTLERISDGSVNIIIGTHSCLSDSVSFKNLGVVIVDEEHKFGVKQREKLIEKTKNGVHSLSMSATPIPRTLALALYDDDIDVQEIKTAPAFKKDVITKAVKTDDELVYDTLLKQLQEGHQAYVICPAIGETDEDDTSDNKIALNGDVAKKYASFLEPYGFKVGMLDGKMKKTEMARIIDDFATNKTQVLVSTTVVEVGVNVPNATLIDIKNAERFGLAQMHQLRGRVGRGSAQGYCILESDDEKSKGRLGTLVESNDGFHIAECDMVTRGAGELYGTVQKGKNPYIDLIIKNLTFNGQVKALVKRLYRDDVMREYFEDYFETAISEMLDEED